MKRKIRHLEQGEQIAVVQWLRVQYPKVLFTSSGAGLITNARTGGLMKKLGYSAGTPDIMIFEPRGGFHGLFIEMKYKDGIVSENQELWIRELVAKNYQAYVCYGFLEAREIIDGYLGGTR